MTKKTHKEFEKWALPYLKKFQKILLLQHFSPLKIEYEPGMKEASAKCTFHYPYQSITVRYSDDLFKDWQKGINVTPTLLHEMCHPLTDPLYSVGYDRYVTKDQLENEREKLTDHIANIILENIKL